MTWYSLSSIFNLIGACPISDSLMLNYPTQKWSYWFSCYTIIPSEQCLAHTMLIFPLHDTLRWSHMLWPRYHFSSLLLMRSQPREIYSKSYTRGFNQFNCSYVTIFSFNLLCMYVIWCIFLECLIIFHVISVWQHQYSNRGWTPSTTSHTTISNIKTPLLLIGKTFVGNLLIKIKYITEIFSQSIIKNWPPVLFQ